MRKVILGLVLAGSLFAPAAASAGGWATAGLGPPQPPDGSGPGDRWVTKITVLQHGETPLAGVEPVLILTNAETGKRIDFPARPTDEVGVYRVVARLPAKGTWDVSVYDGFGEYDGAQTHTFAPITVGDGSAPSTAPTGSPPASAPAPAAASDGSVAVWPLALGAIGAALAAAFVLLARRNRKKAPVVT